MFVLIFHSNVEAHYKAIILDVDGVLVDTEHLKYEAWHYALREKGVIFRIADYYPLVGLSSKAILNAINQKNGSALDDTLIATKEKYYRNKQKNGVPIIQTTLRFLKSCIELKKREGIKVALASSAPMLEILENLRQMDLNKEDFDAITSGKDSLKHIKDPEGVNKPKPYIYQLTAQQLNVSPNECLVFEDSEAGVVAAADAGMDVVALPNKFTQHQNFERAYKVLEPALLNIETFIN